MKRLLTLLFVLLLGLPQVSFGAPAVSPPINRAQAAMGILMTRSDVLPVIHYDGRFPDVPGNAWYAQHVTIAERFGILTADPKSRMLRPLHPVRRIEFLRMLSVAFELPQNLPYLYEDIRESSWYAQYAGIAKKYRLFPGESIPRLKPEAYITEEEAARALEALGATDVDVRSAMEAVRPRTKIAKQKRPSLELVRGEILRLVNVERSKQGLTPVKENARLDLSAQRFAADMTQKGYFSHTSPTGETLKERILATGYFSLELIEECFCIHGYVLGENIARGQRTSADVMRAWMESPSHREAILGPDFTDIGIGLYAGIWVQHFGGILSPK